MSDHRLVAKYLSQQEPGQVYVGVMMSPARAAFIEKMLDVPLCEKCARERDECDADPCGKNERRDTIISLFEQQWRDPTLYADPNRNMDERVDLNQNYEIDDPRDPELNGCWIAAWLFIDFEDTELDTRAEQAQEGMK